MATFKFELVSPERVLMSAEVEQVVLPGTEGDFAVLVGHAPFVSTLRPGVLDVTTTGGRKRLLVKGGFAEVDPARLTVLAEQAFDVADLDAAKVSRELEAAEADLAAARDDEARLRASTFIDQLRALQGGARSH
jgi:F-type H+-transporting ATPase subunit epsilon